MKIVIVSLLALILIFLSVKIKKQAKEKNDQGLKLTSSLFFLTGLNILIVGNALFLIDSKGWTTDNMVNMSLIATISVGLSFLLIGVKVFLRSKKTGFKLGTIAAGFWILTVIMGGLYIMKVGNYASSGWTKERKQDIINNVAEVKFKKLCYLKEVMRKFPNPEDYNNITPTQETELNKTVEDNCLLCDPEFEKRATKEVVGLPDDF